MRCFVGGYSERDEIRVVTGAPDDPGMVLGAATIVPEPELLDGQHITAYAAPAGSAAHASTANDDDIPGSLHGAVPRHVAGPRQ